MVSAAVQATADSHSKFVREICRQGNIKDEFVAGLLLPVEDAVF